MKYLKSAMLVLVIGMMTAISVTAQVDSAEGVERLKKETKSPEQRAEKQTERLTKALDLTEAQAAEVHVINLEYADRAKADREARKAVLQEKDARIQEILTEEQAAKYQKVKKKMKRKAKRGKKGKMRGAERQMDEELRED